MPILGPMSIEGNPAEWLRKWIAVIIDIAFLSLVGTLSICGYIGYKEYMGFYHPPENNLGAVPAYMAISRAKQEAGDQFYGGWMMDADIEPMHGGWCIVLHAAMNTGGIKSLPVIVEQSGRAWRADPLAALIYNGGADGRYVRPGWAVDCKPAVTK